MNMKVSVFRIFIVGDADGTATNSIIAIGIHHDEKLLAAWKVEVEKVRVDLYVT